MNWHKIFHMFTAKWTCLGFEQGHKYVRYKCDICGEEWLNEVHCPY